MGHRIRATLLAGALMTLLVAPPAAFAAASAVGWSPRHLAFASTAVGGTSDTLTLTLSNDTSQPLYILNGDSGGPNVDDFMLGPAYTGDCRVFLIHGAPIPAGGSCFVPLMFSPDETGMHRAWLLFYLAPSPYTQIQDSPYAPTAQLRGRAY